MATAASVTGSTDTPRDIDDDEGTDLAAVARGYVAVTPIHFDLTDHGGLRRHPRDAAGGELERVLESVGT